MKKILQIIEQYHAQQEENTLKIETNFNKLNLQINTAKNVLDELKRNIRTTNFKDKTEEIHFFKHIKPNIYADFIYFTKQLKFEICKPNSTDAHLKNYLKKELQRLENKKRKNIHFYQYYIQNQTLLDTIYFLRENKQLELFSSEIPALLDSEFYTSHDSLAAEVIAYQKLSNFYKQELLKYKRMETSVYYENNKAKIQWSASKTDFIELMYALKASGAVNFGNINTKHLINEFAQFLNLEISNAYKTYTEIKNRAKNRTKFLTTLTNSLQVRLEVDDAYQPRTNS